MDRERDGRLTEEMDGRSGHRRQEREGGREGAEEHVHVPEAGIPNAHVFICSHANATTVSLVVVPAAFQPSTETLPIVESGESAEARPLSGESFHLPT